MATDSHTFRPWIGSEQMTAQTFGVATNSSIMSLYTWTTHLSHLGPRTHSFNCNPVHPQVLLTAPCQETDFHPCSQTLELDAHQSLDFLSPLSWGWNGSLACAKWACLPLTSPHIYSSSSNGPIAQPEDCLKLSPLPIQHELLGISNQLGV